jgi:hypothetical protein
MGMNARPRETTVGSVDEEKAIEDRKKFSVGSRLALIPCKKWRVMRMPI